MRSPLKACSVPDRSTSAIFSIRLEVTDFRLEVIWTGYLVAEGRIELPTLGL